MGGRRRKGKEGEGREGLSETQSSVACRVGEQSDTVSLLHPLGCHWLSSLT